MTNLGTDLIGVADCGQPEPIVGPVYYRVSRIKEEEVVRYTLEEAKHLAFEVYQHAGPWDETLLKHPTARHQLSEPGDEDND